MEPVGTALALLGALAACVLLSKVARWAATLRALSSLPHPKMGFLGAWELLQDGGDHMAQIFTRFANQLGGIFYVRVLHVPMVVVADPALWQAALAPGTDLPKAPGVYGTMDQMTSPGGRSPNLLCHHLHSGYWKLVRKGVAPAFNPRNIRNEFPHVLELTEQLCAALYRAGAEQYVDVDNLLQRESLDVIARIGFATEFGAIKAYRPPDPGSAADAAGPTGTLGPQQGGEASAADGRAIDTENIFGVLTRAEAEVVARLANPARFLLRRIAPACRAGERHLRTYQARMRALLAGIKARGPPAEGDTSIAAHLLRLRDPDTGTPLSDEQLAAEIGLFFFAGGESTGHTMAWALMLLAQHPEAEEKVCAELDALGLLVTPARPRPRPLLYADLSQLKYLSWVVKEAMRMVPVSGGTVRVSPDRPVVLGGHTIPAGVQILLAVHALHNCERQWERPEEFRPERWEDPQAEYWCVCAHAAALTQPRQARPAQLALLPLQHGCSRSRLCAHPGRRLGGGAAGGNARGGGGGASGQGLELLEDEEALRVDAARPPKRFMPFAGGVRNCIGQNLAKMNAHATLALLLSRFTFRLPPELMGPGAIWDIHVNRLSMQPRDGLPMRCIPRPGTPATAT